MNAFILGNIKFVEIMGVTMRIVSFTLVSWLGPESPFLFVWVLNTSDAVILSWCAILRKDTAYTMLNCFWVMVGVIGVLRTMSVV